MLAQAIDTLRAVAADDPTVRPLALLQAEALRAAAEPAWEESAAHLGPGRVASGEPLLHEQTLTVEPELVRALLARLIEAAGRAGVEEAGALRRALTSGGNGDSPLDPLALLHASITWDSARLRRMAGDAWVAAPAMATLGHLATLPLLLACGQRAATLMPNVPWAAGYCPLCAAWPALVELRGLERQRWLRCGRCGAGWRFRHQECSFCANVNHQTLGYLAPVDEKESRRAVTCACCRGYLKTLTTVAPLTPPEILVQDLTSLELDVTALEQGYSRPERPGFALKLQLLPATREAPRAQHRWLPWR